MDKAEATGFGVAAAGHAALLAALTLGFANARLPTLHNPPIEVAFVDEVALESAAPAPSVVEPAPRLAEVEGPVEPLSPPVPVAEPVPLPRPKAVTPAPPRAVAQRPAPAKAAPKQAASRPTGRLKGILTGVSDRASDSRAETPPARTAGPAVQASLGAEVRRQLKPHWQSPSGADVDQLRTTVQVRLARDGSLASEPRVLRQTGLTASNRAQAALHAERAIRAVRLAAPFDLPEEFYDSWKVISPVFDKRL